MIHSVLDSDKNGYLDFKEFQQAIDLVGARLPDDRLRWSFKLYDEDNSGSIALDEMEKVARPSKTEYKYLCFRSWTVFTTCLKEWVRDPPATQRKELEESSGKSTSTVMGT